MEQTEQDYVTTYLAESLQSLETFVHEPVYRETLAAMAEATLHAMKSGNKLLIAGNGGSAGDAQHIAGEFISRLMFDRAPLPAVALTTDSSVLTSAGNDYGFDVVFERQVIGLGLAGDVFLGISTSGRSRNVIRALDAARARGMITLGFCGAEPGPMADRCDLVLAAPSRKTAQIQQIHIVAAHIFCALVERAAFPAEASAVMA